MSEAAAGGGWAGLGRLEMGWVETIKPLLLECFVRQMSAGRPVLFRRSLFSVLLVSRLFGEKDKRKGVFVLLVFSAPLNLSLISMRLNINFSLPIVTRRKAVFSHLNSQILYILGEFSIVFEQ